jgi:hypothetical protein
MAFHDVRYGYILVDGDADGRRSDVGLSHTVSIRTANCDHVGSGGSSAIAATTTAAAAAGSACRKNDETGQYGPKEQESHQVLLARTSGTEPQANQHQSRYGQPQRIEHAGAADHRSRRSDRGEGQRRTTAGACDGHRARASEGAGRRLTDDWRDTAGTRNSTGISARGNHAHLRGPARYCRGVHMGTAEVLTNTILKTS